MGLDEQNIFFDKSLIKEKLEAPDFSPNALRVIEKRYLRRNTKGEIIETPQEMLIRVAENIAAIDHRVYNKPVEEFEHTFLNFYHLMAKGYFLPKSPTLMNAGTSVQQLSACFVLPVEDNMEGIFDSLKWTALVLNPVVAQVLASVDLGPRMT